MPRPKRKRSGNDASDDEAIAAGPSSSPGTGGGDGQAGDGGSKGKGQEEAPGKWARGGKQAKSQARSKTEETWRDLSRGELAKIVQRLYEPNAATGLKKAHLVKFLEAHIWDMMSCARKLMEVCDTVLAIVSSLPPDALTQNPGERAYLSQRLAGLRAAAVEHIACSGTIDPRTCTADKIHRAQLNAPLAGLSLPTLALFLRDSVVAAAPAATCAVCVAFDAMRAEVQLRTSVRVYREMPSLRNTLYDVVVTTELVDDLIARVFGALPAEAEGASLHLQPPEGEGAAGGDSDAFTAREEVTAAAAAAAAAATQYSALRKKSSRPLPRKWARRRQARRVRRARRPRKIQTHPSGPYLHTSSFHRRPGRQC